MQPSDMGEVALGLGFLDKAVNAGLEGVALDPTNCQGVNKWLYCLAGRAERTRNDLDGRKEHLDRARTHYINALKIDENAIFYVLLGVVHMGLKERPSAESCFRKALALESSNEEAMYNLAEVIWAGSGDECAPAQAVELYRKAIAIDPQYAQAHRGLAYVLFASQQYEEAEDYARLALKFDRSDWAAHVIVGRLLLRKRKIRAARRSLERGAELAPFAWEAQARLADFYDDHGSLIETQRMFRRCLDIDPDDAWANRRYGAVLGDMGKPFEARIFLKRAVALDPSDKFAPEYLEKLDKMYPHRSPKRQTSGSKRKPHDRE